MAERGGAALDSAGNERLSSADTDLPPSDTGSSSGDTGSSFNIIKVACQLAEDHLSLVRSLSAALAAAGVVLLARSVKLTAKFGAASEIPPWFVEKNVRLRGRVRGLSHTGLWVEHIPIRVPLLSPLLEKRHSDGLLDVRLAGVDLTEDGRSWLREKLTPADTVWFRLLHREADTLDCLVSVSRNAFFHLCVNEELLRLGLGRTVPITGLHYRSRLYWGLHKRLLRAEAQAERRGRGLWKRESGGSGASAAVRRLLMKLLRRA